jgi:excisionase family DNA binding protein
MPPTPLPPDALPSWLHQGALTIPDVVRRYGIGRTKLYDLIREGRLDARKLGARTLVTVASLDALLASLPPVHRSAA